MRRLWHEWESKSIGEIITARVRAWWRFPDSPTPWPEELDIAVRAPDAIPVCHCCTTPCELPVWFCPVCGTAVGPYNNILPFIRIFSLGEVFRSGVRPTARFTPLTVPGYILVAFQQLWFFALLYYLRLIMNYIKIRRQRNTQLSIAH